VTAVAEANRDKRNSCMMEGRERLRRQTKNSTAG